jgi:hypothetical protein
VCELADKELPAAWAVGDVVSNIKISEVLVNLWGKKWEIERLWGESDLPPVAEEKEEDQVTKTAEAEGVLPIDSEEFLADAPTREAISDALEEEPPAIPAERVGQKVEEQAAPKPDEPAAESKEAPADAKVNNGWDEVDDTSRWGTEPPKTSSGWAWAAAHLDRPPEWKIPEDVGKDDNNGDAAAKGEAKQQQTQEEDSWAVYHPPSLTEVLGPTNLPVTHHAGIVEQSTRRVKAVLPPVVDSPTPSDGDDASAVEAKLRSQFARVIFIPWAAGSDALALRPEGKSDVVPPSILHTSVGRVAPEKHGHNMERDEIEVLMDADKANKFLVGMGFTGTWVQIAREGDKGGEKGRLWYMEYVSQFLPSFYVNCLY